MHPYTVGHPSRIPRVYGRVPTHPFTVYGRILGCIPPYPPVYAAVYSEYLFPISMHLDHFVVRISRLLLVQAQYDPWPLWSITNYEVVGTNMELVPPRAAARQVVSGWEWTEPIAIGRGVVASAPVDLACTSGKYTGYYSRLNVHASGTMYDIQLPIRVVANLKEGLVDAFWEAAVWSKSSGKGRLFFRHNGGQMGLFRLHHGAPKFFGAAIPS